MPQNLSSLIPISVASIVPVVLVTISVITSGTIVVIVPVSTIIISVTPIIISVTPIIVSVSTIIVPVTSIIVPVAMVMTSPVVTVITSSPVLVTSPEIQEYRSNRTSEIIKWTRNYNQSSFDVDRCNKLYCCFHIMNIILSQLLSYKFICFCFFILFKSITPPIYMWDCKVWWYYKVRWSCQSRMVCAKFLWCDTPKSDWSWESLKYSGQNKIGESIKTCLLH